MRMMLHGVHTCVSNVRGQVGRVLESLRQRGLRLDRLEVRDVNWLLVGLASRVHPEAIEYGVFVN